MGDSHGFCGDIPRCCCEHAIACRRPGDLHCSGLQKLRVKPCRAVPRVSFSDELSKDFEGKAVNSGKPFDQSTHEGLAWEFHSGGPVGQISQVAHKLQPGLWKWRPWNPVPPLCHRHRWPTSVAEALLHFNINRPCENGKSWKIMENRKKNTWVP